ncbi:MAG: Dabb family protein [Planctomycetota bacterium]|jgi:hypothetical protein
MFIHAVYFTLKEGATDDDRNALRAGLDALIKAPSIVDAFVGTPADTDRPVIDKNYDFALIVRFQDQAGHDAYQIDPIHDKFREDCERFWSGVRIFDAVG